MKIELKFEDFPDSVSWILYILIFIIGAKFGYDLRN